MTAGGAATSVASGLSLNHIGIIIGIVVGLAGLALQWYYGRQRNRREQELHRLQVLRLTQPMEKPDA